MSALFTPLTIREVTFRNRLGISPMCQYSSTDGFASDWHLVHLGSRAVGGSGLIIQEATAVSPEGRISSSDAGIYYDEHIQKWKAITQFIRQQGAVAGIQLAHAGRKASVQEPWNGGKQIRSVSGGWDTVAPSSIPFLNEDAPPRELDPSGIRKVIEDFKAAAHRALQAGYQVIELHAAHGYLIHEFLSPLSNHRTDEYGGSFDNRVRLLVEITKAVRGIWPESLPLFVRISATDWTEGGWNEEESVKLAQILQKLGVDLIDCSTGGLVAHARIPAGPGYQVPFSSRIKKQTGMLTGAVGLITSPQQAEEILHNQQADLIFIARASLRDPYFALHAAEALGDGQPWPNQYLRARH